MSNTLPIHEPVVEFVVKVQDTVLQNLTKASNTVAEQLPNLPISPADDFVARGGDYADAGFALAEELLGQNRAFVANLFGLAKGFVSSMVEADVVKMPAKKAA